MQAKKIELNGSVYAIVHKGELFRFRPIKIVTERTGNASANYSSYVFGYVYANDGSIEPVTISGPYDVDAVKGEYAQYAELRAAEAAQMKARDEANQRKQALRAEAKALLMLQLDYDGDDLDDQINASYSGLMIYDKTIEALVALLKLPLPKTQALREPK